MIGNIVALIDKYELDHQLIEIELTESEDYQNFELITEIVNGLRANGIVTSMDDFGTGFSSLNMIKNVDLQVIKIDKSFIPLEKDYEGKDKDLIMFYYIIKMVKSLARKLSPRELKLSSSLTISEKLAVTLFRALCLTSLCLRLSLRNGLLAVITDK